MTDHVTGGKVDIVERLRKPRGGPLTGEWPGPTALELEAATEIERLRARLKDAETVYGIPAQIESKSSHRTDYQIGYSQGICDQIEAQEYERKIAAQLQPEPRLCPVCGINNNSPFPCEHSVPAQSAPDPDAWMREDGSAATVNPMTAGQWKGQGMTVIPLYAAPAQQMQTAPTECTLIEHGAPETTGVNGGVEASPASALPRNNEISKSWQVLEGHGFPPEACGWPFESIVGELPTAIDCAIDCLIRQRNELSASVFDLQREIIEKNIKLINIGQALLNRADQDADVLSAARRAAFPSTPSGTEPSAPASESSHG